VIPAASRRQFDLQPGDAPEARAEDDRLVLETRQAILELLDASALLALIRHETRGDVVARRIDGSAISAVNWCEVHERLERSGADTRGLRPDMKARPTTNRSGLSLADRACLSLASELGRRALTGDRTWLALDVGVDIEPTR